MNILVFEIFNFIAFDIPNNYEIFPKNGKEETIQSVVVLRSWKSQVA